MQKPTHSELMAPPLNISRGHACDILTGSRQPSAALAIRIYRETGWKHPKIAMLSGAEIDILARIELSKAA